MKQSILITFLIAVFSAQFTFAQVEIWVSPKGNDLGEGTSADPYATVHRALRKARNLRRLNDNAISDGITIKVIAGQYLLEETLILHPEDAGTATSPTTIIGVEGMPILSGGVAVNDWKLSTRTDRFSKKAQGKIWEAPLPRKGGRTFEFRQLWVNDVKAIRASSFNDGELDRIISVDKTAQTLTIPKAGFSAASIDQLEFVIHQWWAIANLRVKAIEESGDNWIVKFHQPESKVEFEHPWPAPFIDEKKEYNGNSAFYFVNAPELLNSPGEWYEDLDAGKIYYWPRKGEDLSSAEVVVPYLETLVSFEGNVDTPVEFVTFENIGFEHTTWLRPSLAGHVPLQAGFYLTDAYKLKEPGTADKKGLENQGWLGRQTAAITLSGAQNNTFKGCSFRHMAATGLDMVTATNHNLVQGNLFQDIGGTAIQVGFFGDQSVEAHLPYNPSDERTLSHHETIANNLVTDATNEDWGCVGIGVGFAHDILVTHNEVSNVFYTGISVGWGWTKTVTCMKNNQVVANHIHHFAKMMYDVGGIYMLGAQPKSYVAENSIHDLEKAPYAHIPKHYQYIYFDEGSSFIKCENNWTEKDKFFANANGPGNEWINNGPDVDKEIKEAAGLEPQFEYLFDWIKK